MKQFFGAFFGSLIGIVLATVVALLIIVGIVKSTMGSAFKDDKETSIIKENSILKIDLDGQIQEREKENPFKDLGSLSALGGETGLGLNTLIKKINYAKTDDKIKGIYLSFKNMNAGFATIQELRAALENFKKKK